MGEKEAFLDEFGGEYGYPNGPKSIDQIRATEFKRLDSSGTVYLDHAGATLYSESQMEAIFEDLTGSLYGNPHSQSESSSVTSDAIRDARQQVLEYLNASQKDYKCIFTSGATSALKLVGESFPWSSKSSFMYTMENHNSVLGIREYALGKGAEAFAVDVKEGQHHDGVPGCPGSSLKISPHPVQKRNQARFVESELGGDAYNLFAFPSECNFSGLRFNLDLVKNLRENAAEFSEGSPFAKGHWMILLDAAKGCATQPPDLSLYPADFVVISFYKLFGYPTGLGALIVRNDAANLLKKTYFSGGTVAASIADIDFVKRREGVEELFEDGTSSFLSIASIRHGFKILNSLTTSAMHRHTASLAIYVKKRLLSLRHDNGTSVCTVYGSQTLKVSCHDSSPTVTFNLKRPDGSWFGYREVEKLATLSGIQLRTGCFCNPGACAKYLDLSHSDLLSNIEAGHICWDDNDVIQGKPTGAVRVSFGYMSTFEDAKKFIDFIGASFISILHKQVNGYPLTSKPFPFQCKGIESVASSGYSLKSITIYPIKSCGGFSVESWPLSSTGLRHDREWLIKSLTGEILTQKKVPEMSLISTFIDLNMEMMYVNSSRCKTKLPIKLVSNSNQCGREGIYIHGQRYEAQRYNSEINQWLSDAVGRPCELLRCCHFQCCSSLSRNRTDCRRDMESPMSFANEGHFLLISEESVSDLNNRLRTNTRKGIHTEQLQVNAMRFRPNLIISGGEPYIEDGWSNLKIGDFHFRSLGGCNRCQMINIFHQAEQVQKSNEPLATLASYRRVKGKILFGILLSLESGMGVELDQNTRLQVGDQIFPYSEC